MKYHTKLFEEISKNVEIIKKMISEKRPLAYISRFFKIKDTTLKRYLKKMNIEYSGNKSCSGLTRKRIPSTAYLGTNKNISSKSLKEKLIYDGIKENKCESCGLTTWLGKQIPLELHHKDNNHYNNNLENLEILCSNCHSMRHNYFNKYILKDNNIDIKNNHFCIDCGKKIQNRKEQLRCKKCDSIHRMKYSDEDIKNIAKICYESGAFYRAYKILGYKNEANIRRIFKTRQIPTKKKEFRKWYENTFLNN